VSLLMLAVVALFPVTLLAILLLTSGLEGKFVRSDERRRLIRPNPPPPRQARDRSSAGHD
jgi:hypothetical protein